MTLLLASSSSNQVPEAIEEIDPMTIATRAAAQQTPDRSLATSPPVNFNAPLSSKRTWTMATST